MTKEETIEVEITGVTPLLQHRFADQEAETPTVKRKSKTDKENNVEDTLYKLPDGTVYQPSESIRQALINAGKAFKKGKSNLSKTAGSFVEVNPEAIPHVHQDWEVDRRAVVIPSTKGRVMRNRARFNTWALQFTIKIHDTDEIKPETLKEMLEHAGKYQGIGDYRPEKRGMFGRFMVTEFKLQ